MVNHRVDLLIRWRSASQVYSPHHVQSMSSTCRSLVHRRRLRMLFIGPIQEALPNTAAVVVICLEPVVSACPSPGHYQKTNKSDQQPPGHKVFLINLIRNTIIYHITEKIRPNKQLCNSLLLNNIKTHFKLLHIFDFKESRYRGTYT